MHKARYIILISLWLIAGWLLSDASLMALHPNDLATGRVHGCYTTLEIWTGMKHPSSWMRNIEWITALLILIGSLLIFRHQSRKIKN